MQRFLEFRLINCDWYILNTPWSTIVLLVYSIALRTLIVHSYVSKIVLKNHVFKKLQDCSKLFSDNLLFVLAWLLVFKIRFPYSIQTNSLNLAVVNFYVMLCLLWWLWFKRCIFCSKFRNVWKLLYLHPNNGLYNCWPIK